VTSAEDRLRDVTTLGAAHAASAVAKLLDLVDPSEPPRCCRVNVADLAESVFEPEELVAGVFVDVTGSVRGRMGLVLSRDVLREVLERFAIPETGEFDARVQSVVGELGNIAVSAGAGALGELEGGVAIPSVPWVGYDMAGALLLEAFHPSLYRSAAYVAETEFGGGERSLRLRFLWVPEG
jgi:chemotaxis protein CheC